MTIDVLDPGPDFTYPNVPRLPDGRLDVQRMPIGTRMQNGVLIDVEPTVRDAAGRLVKISEVVPP